MGMKIYEGTNEVKFVCAGPFWQELSALFMTINFPGRGDLSTTQFSSLTFQPHESELLTVFPNYAMFPNASVPLHIF